MAQELHGLRQESDDLLIYPPRDIEALKRPIRDKHSIESIALAFLNKLRPAPRLWRNNLSESSDLSPSLVCAV